MHSEQRDQINFNLNTMSTNKWKHNPMFFFCVQIGWTRIRKRKESNVEKSMLVNGSFQRAKNPNEWNDFVISRRCTQVNGGMRERATEWMTGEFGERGMSKWSQISITIKCSNCLFYSKLHSECGKRHYALVAVGLSKYIGYGTAHFNFPNSNDGLTHSYTHIHPL